MAPPGWHLPSKAEFETLLNNLGGSGANAYQQIIPGGSSGFNALVGGWRDGDGGFGGIESVAGFWSSSEYGNGNAGLLSVNSGSQEAYMYNGYEKDAFSVRLLKDWLTIWNSLKCEAFERRKFLWCRDGAPAFHL